MKKLLALFALMTASTFCFGQATSTTGGSIQGSVTDPSGAVIPGATVVIADPEIGYSHTMTTDSAGYYSLGPLTPGSYTVTISAGNFENLKVTTVVRTGTVTSGNEKLTLGKATETVEVNAGAIQVNTDQIGVAGVITSEQIDSLPVNGRNILDIAQIQPGVILESGMTFDPTKAGYSAISTSGVGGRTTRILLDGQDITDETVGTTIFNVPSGPIDELQLNRSTQDVSGEVTSTGQVLVSTRSGTNAFHGNAFYNFQDYRAGFANVGGYNAPFQRNQWGGYAGGYIIKDKLFFFGGSERIQQHEDDVAQSVSFPGLIAEYPYTPAPFHDTYNTARLDYNAPWAIHLFARATYSVNSDDATFGYGPYQIYQNRDNVPALVGGADFTTGRFTHSIRGGYEKFHNILEDGTAGLGSSIYNPSTGPNNEITLVGALNAGPNFLAPQQTFQSDKQLRYDGTWTKGAHNIKFGGEMNRILNGGFAAFYGPSLYTDFGGGNELANCNGVAGAAPCPGNPTEGYFASLFVIGNGNGYFSERPGFGLPGGGDPSWRFGAYVADTWKVKPSLTVTAGVRWSVDTDRANQDLPTPLCSSVGDGAAGTSMQFTGCTGSQPLFSQFQSGLGVQTHQPYANFGPQIGGVYSPGSHKTSYRAGAGIYYDSNVFNNTGNARTESIQSPGAFFNYGLAFDNGTSISLPGYPTVYKAPDGTPVSTILSPNTSIAVAAPEINAIKAAYQAKVKNVASANPSYIGTANGLFANNIYSGPYKSPYSIQYNAGVQREISKGIIFSADYVHNSTLKVPISIDVNHNGAARTLNTTAATNAILYAISGFPTCPQTASAAAINCAIANGANIDTFAESGLDSGTAYLGSTAASNYGAPIAYGAAFPGTNPNVGTGLFIFPGGKSAYDALQVVLQEQKSHPLPGIVTSNMQFSYSLSRIVTATATGGSGNVSDQFFAGASGWDNDNPAGILGRNNLDHTNELSFGGSLGIKYGAQVGFIGHFFSAPPTSLVLDATSGAVGQIFTTDVNGDGRTVGALVPGTVPGAYMHSVKGAGLNALITKYNDVYAGTLTPAGQALVSAGLFTQQQLVALGAVQQQIAVPSTPTPISNSAFRTFDLSASYPIKKWLEKYHEGLSIVPGIAMYNVFNMSNFGSLDGTLLNTSDCNAANCPPGYLNTGNSQTIQNAYRASRNSGTFDAGGPRTTEYQLKVTF